MKDEALLLAIKNRVTKDVGGQQVAGELNALKGSADRTGKRLRHRGFANARDVFDQQMAARQQARDSELHRLDLTNDNFTNLRGERIDLLLHTQQSTASRGPANTRSVSPVAGNKSAGSFVANSFSSPSFRLRLRAYPVVS